MNTILSFGEALIDFHGLAPTAPGQRPSFVPYPGGAPANVAVAVARLGGRAAFVGMLGIDLFGDMLFDSLVEAGVDTRHVRRTGAANTALAFVSHDANGERSFSFYRPPAADLLFRDNDFEADAFAHAAVFHCCSNSLTESPIAEATLAGMRLARAAGALVSFDMNLRPALWPKGENPTPRLWTALDAADLVKLSAEEFAFLAAPLGSEEYVRERLWRGAARVLVITDGAAPIRWVTRHAEGALPAFNVSALDSTGAGDAFVGGLLAGLAEQPVVANVLDAFVADSPRRDAWLRFAAACGALAVTRTGSFAAMPARADVERFLATHNADSAS